MAKRVEAIDGGWGWMVVVGSCICHFFLCGVNRTMGIIFVLLRERFDASATQSSVAASIFVSIRAVGGPVATKLSDKFGCRLVVMVGGVLLCVGFILSAFATDIVHVYVTFGTVAGIGGVLMYSPSYVAVSQWFDKKKGKAMAFSTLGTGFGNICLAPIIMALVYEYNYFGTMLIMGALLFNVCIGGALYRPPVLQRAPVNVDEKAMMAACPSPETVEVTKAVAADVDDTKQLKETTNDEDGGDTTTVSKKSASGWRKCPQISLRSSLWTNVPFIVYCLLIVAIQGCIHSVLLYLPARGRELGASPEAASLLLTLFGAFDMGGRFVFGFVFDLPWFLTRRPQLYTAVALTFAVTAVLVAAADGYVSLAVMTCIVALFEGGAHSQRATNVTDLVEPQQMSIGVGLVILFQGLGNFLGPVIGAVLADKTGSYAVCFTFSGSALIVVCLLTAVENYVRQRRVSRASHSNGIVKQTDSVL